MEKTKRQKFIQELTKKENAERKELRIKQLAYRINILESSIFSDEVEK